MLATKVDLKRELKALYSAGGEPELVEVPELSFLMIDGHGDPNTNPDYGQAIAALFTVAYTVKFALKRAPDGLDYGVMPPEGLWWAPDLTSFASGDKSAWLWTMMILQPDQVTPELVEEARPKAAAKVSPEVAARIRLERFTEGLAAQVMHVGPFAAEAETISRLHEFIAGLGYERSGKHHEIYLSDPRRVAPEKLKTIVRQPVAATGRGG